MQVPAEGDIAFAPAALASYPCRDGNFVKVRRSFRGLYQTYVGGSAFYTRLEEAVRKAQGSVWCVVAFAEWTFQMPSGIIWWDLLAQAQQRGVDVRVLFWRNVDERWENSLVRKGREMRLEMARQGWRWRARWDSSGDDAQHCHHQKAFVVDVGTPGCSKAFVGGMPLQNQVYSDWHDVFAEVQGPSVQDVAHNFAQRWNQARRDPMCPDWPPSLLQEERELLAASGWATSFASDESETEWDRDTHTESEPDDDHRTAASVASGAGAVAAAAEEEQCEIERELPYSFPATGSVGNVRVQIARTIKAGLYSSLESRWVPEERQLIGEHIDSNATGAADVIQRTRKHDGEMAVDQAHEVEDDEPVAAVAALPIPLREDGEASIMWQYASAFRSAKHSILIESQHCGEATLLMLLEEALKRGVVVVFIVPARPMAPIRHERRKYDQYREQCAALAAERQTRALRGSMDPRPSPRAGGPLADFGALATATPPLPAQLEALQARLSGWWAANVTAKLPGLSNLPQAAAVVGDRVEENAADAEAELKQRQSAKTDAAATAIDRTREATMTDANSGRVVATGPSPDRELAGAAVGVVGKKAPEEKWLSYTSDSSFRDSSAMDGGGDSAWAAGGSDRSAVEEGEGTVTGNRAPSSASDTVAEEKAAAPVVQDELPVLPAKPYYAPIFEFLAVLGEYDNFTMAALVEPRRAGESGIRTLYVHSKTCIVDGEWATIGSANLVDLSLTPNHTEMNIAFWDGDTALGLLNELTGSHLQVPWHDAGWRHDVTGRAQVEMLTEAARTNSISLERRNVLQTGRMLQLDPAQYAAM